MASVGPQRHRKKKCAQYIVLILLHVSATSRRLLQEVTVTGDTCSMLCNLSAVNGELYPHMAHCNYYNYITITIPVIY